MSAPPPYSSRGEGRGDVRRGGGGELPHTCYTSVCRNTERNVLSGLVNLGVVVMACGALGHPKWFWLEGGSCSTHTLGLSLFFTMGHFSQATEGHQVHGSPLIYYANGQELRMCVTDEVVLLLQVVIGLTFVVVGAGMVQVILDLTAPPSRILSCLRKNAISSIIAVWVCVVTVGVTSHVATLIETQQIASMSLQPDVRVQVKFDVGFYLLVIAGWLSVLGVGCSWLRPAYIFQEMDTEPLMEDWEGLEIPALLLDTNPPLSSPPPSLPFLSELEPPPPMEGHPPPPYMP